MIMRSHPVKPVSLIVAAVALVLLAHHAPTALGATVTRPATTRSYNRPHPCEQRAPLVCVLSPTAGSTVSGTVRFTAERSQRAPSWWWLTRCAVRVRATVSGLATGAHGMHIHSYGDRTAADTGKSAGGHFPNPWFDAVQHGFPVNAQRHWGDLGNLVAGADGVARYDRVDDTIALWGIVGRGMVIHAAADRGPDSQPSGGAGPRQAMCVIGYANAELVKA